MVVKWKKEGKRWLSKLIVNIIGVFILYVIIVILFVYWLGDIWFFFIIMLIVMFIFYKIYDYYKKVVEQFCLENDVKLYDYDGNIVFVLVGNVIWVNIGVLNYVCLIGDYVVVMYVLLDEDVEKEKEIEVEFKKYFLDVCFLIVYFFYCLIENLIIWYVDIVSKNVVK